MGYWLATTARSLLGRRPELICDGAIWDDGIRQLARRTRGGRRESGAFLLGRRGTPSIIERFVYYEDIDPEALETGIVLIDGRRLGDLWKICREAKLEVVADVHVHPGSFRQSASDKANPIIAERNHIALILPDFAQGSNMPGKIGVHRYLGNRQWRDESDRWFPPFHVGRYAWN
jgi:proteasome lid subunit RPN8/RPN11